MCESDSSENTSEFSTSGKGKSTGENDLLVLHKAAAILKKNIAEQIKYNSNNKSSYVHSNNINEENCRKEIPDLLYTFISWVLNDSSFSDGIIKDFDICYCYE